MQKKSASSVILLKGFSGEFAPPRQVLLQTGVNFPTPKDKYFASDVYVTNGNVDWNAEYILAAFLKSLPQKHDFLDIGAHLGYYSILLSPFVRKSFAFEPDPRNHKLLEDALGNFSNTDLIPMAVANKDGDIVLCNEDESSISHIDPTASAGTRVQVVSIDRFVSERCIEPVAIKIDIEGFDILALQGSIETCRNHSPVFLIEYYQEPDRPNTWEALADFVSTVNYSIFGTVRQPHGLLDLKYSFARRQVSDLKSLNYKMIFLVPPTHLDWFKKHSEDHKSWLGIGLKSNAIKKILS